jgi:transcription-repair coupling factor (superfamily II helicase)
LAEERARAAAAGVLALYAQREATTRPPCELHVEEQEEFQHQVGRGGDDDDDDDDDDIHNMVVGG